MEKAKKHNVEILLPTDYITASSFSRDADSGYATDQDGIPDEWLGLDCGQKSIEKFNQAIKQSKTILWNGPAGVFEFPKFAGGSISMLDACIEAAKSGSTVIVGGGDTATCTSPTLPLRLLDLVFPFISFLVLFWFGKVVNC